MSLLDTLPERVRRLGAGVALAGAVGLAGCGSNPQEADAEHPSPSGSAGHSATGGQTPPGTRSGPGAQAGSGTHSAECEAQIDELTTEFNTVNQKLAKLEQESRDRKIAERGLNLLADQLRNGFSSDTIRTAESVGTSVRESVLYLDVYRDGANAGSGTGWFVDDGRILTNAHVAGGWEGKADTVDCTTVDGDTFSATVTDHFREQQPDMALLETDYTGSPALTLGSSTDLTEGEPLLQVGHPGSVGNWVLCLGKHIARTEVVGPNRTDYNLQTVVQGLSGVSGSPLVDLDGDVVGMTWGGGPPWQREFGEQPVPAPDEVFDVPLSPIGISKHLAVESIEEVLETW